MIAARQQSLVRQKGSDCLGWAVSVLLHGAVALAAVTLMKHTKLPLQPDPFRWEISLVSSPELVQPTVGEFLNVPLSGLVEPATSLIAAQAAAVQGNKGATLSALTLQVAAQSRTTGDMYQVVEQDGSVSFTNVPSDSHYRKVTIDSTRLSTLKKQPEASVAGSRASASQMAREGTPDTDSMSWLWTTLHNRLNNKVREGVCIPQLKVENILLIRFVMRGDGSISELRVLQSSGRSNLDSAMIGILQAMAPIPLSRPLGWPYVTVTWPFFSPVAEKNPPARTTCLPRFHFVPNHPLRSIVPTPGPDAALRTS